MKKQQSKTDELIVIKQPKLKGMEVVVDGTSDLIMHAFGAKAKADLENRKPNREAKTPEKIQEICEDCLHKYNGGYGFPSSAFKKGMIRIMKQKGYPMVDASTWFNVLGEYSELVDYGKWKVRIDKVSLRGSADLRYRPSFNKWAIKLLIKYNEDRITKESLLSVLSEMGEFIGIGDWRIEKNGSFGSFKIRGVK